jgi:hydrogenase-4 component E
VSSLVELLLTLVILGNLVLAGAGRLALSIRVLALQAIVLGCLPLALYGAANVHFLALAGATILLKGFVFPRLLYRAQRDADAQHEAVPFVGYSTSVLAAVLALTVSLWLAPRLAPATMAVPPLLLSVALFTLLTGLFLIVSRRIALTQVVGYLALENGIFLFGLALANDEPLLVEMGVLLDVFVAVFVMGIAIFHISREFDHIEADQLTTLKD